MDDLGSLSRLLLTGPVTALSTTKTTKAKLNKECEVYVSKYTKELYVYNEGIMPLNLEFEIRSVSF